VEIKAEFQHLDGLSMGPHTPCTKGGKALGKVAEGEICPDYRNPLGRMEETIAAKSLWGGSAENAPQASASHLVPAGKEVTVVRS